MVSRRRCIGVLALALVGCGGGGEVDSGAPADLTSSVDQDVPIDLSVPTDFSAAADLAADAGDLAQTILVDGALVDGECDGCGATVPQAPTGVSVAQHDNSFTVSWVAPANTGGIPLDSTAGFLVTWTPNPPAQPIAVASTATSTMITGLTVGTSYTVSVAAQNAVGPSSYAGAAPAIFAKSPSAPANVVLAAGPGSAQIVISWDAQTLVQAGGLSATYLVALSDGSHQMVTTNTATAGSLVNGTVYTATVQAINAVGQSAATPGSNAAMPWNPPGVPSAPVGPTATQSATNPAQVTVSWSPPIAPGAAPVSGYAIAATTGGITQTTMVGNVTSTAINVTGGSSYMFTVAATNTTGTGPAATASPNPLAVVGPPPAPSAPTATSANGSITVSWSAPSNSGGGALGNYSVEACDASGNNCNNVQSVAGTSFKYTTLTVGTVYTFRVAASNQYGPGPFSTQSGAVTFATAPSAPTITNVSVNGSGSILVTWTAPSANGSAITGYNLTATSSNGGATGSASASSSATSASIGGLGNCKTYTVTMTATNGMGTSAASAPSSAVSPTAAPSTPLAPSVSYPSPSSGDALSVSWSAPNDQGCAIDQYQLYVYKNGTYLETVSVAPPTTSTVVTSLSVCPFSTTDCSSPNNYAFQVVAHNAGGFSGASTTSGSVRPLVSYAGDNVATIWTSSTTAWGGLSGTCTSCHTNGLNPLVLDGTNGTTSYNSILNTACVVKNSGASMGTSAYLLQCSINASGCTPGVCPPSGTGAHPGGGLRFNPNTLPYDLILTWINDGLLP
jgi:hypothetical protein